MYAPNHLARGEYTPGKRHTTNPNPPPSPRNKNPHGPTPRNNFHPQKAKRSQSPFTLTFPKFGGRSSHQFSPASYSSGLL